MAAHPEHEVLISRDELEYVLVPWFGRPYERWVRLHARPHPIDPLAVLIPRELYEEYRQRPKLSPLTEAQKRRLGARAVAA